ncbi:MAG: heterodisulfide reductase-related iron-sulfur binding cluster [Acidimicrobiales bacterium]
MAPTRACRFIDQGRRPTSRRATKPPWLTDASLRRTRLAATGTDVFLHTGCVMDAWYRPPTASISVLDRMGIGVRLPESGGACCGALSEHAGDHPTARSMAERTMAAFPGDAPILVNSAGCGAAMKDYGDLLGTESAPTIQRPSA